jgi:porphobilinogen synthase
MTDHTTGQAVWSAPRIRPRRMRRSQVSGEYAMIEAAAARGWISREPAVLETLLSIRRAGASIILTYWATAAARRLR